MQHIPLQNLVTSCFLFVTTLYGSWGLLTEFLKTILPFGLILVLCLVCLGYFLKVPAPSQEQVEAVIGKDPCTVTNGDNTLVIKTVAHRGAGLDAPENSLEAFQLCSEKGCNAIELDITLTKDDVPVIFHDNTLERMTDSHFVISEHSWDELSGVDISVKHMFRDRFAKTNIPTLDQAVTQLLQNGQRMILDIKNNDKKMVKIIHNLFERFPDLYSRAVVSSFYPNIIYLIRRGDPKIVCSLAWRPHSFANESYNYPTGRGARKANKWYNHYLLVLCDFLHEWALTRITYYLLGISLILLHKDVINGRAIIEWKNRGVRVMAWTVNTPAEKQYLAKVLKITYLTDTLTAEQTTHSTP